MKIQTLSNYDNVETVDARDLKRLIAEKKIMAFRRLGGWVRLGVDAVRGEGGKEYDGPERRNVIQKPLTTEQRLARFRCLLGIRGPMNDW